MTRKQLATKILTALGSSNSLGCSHHANDLTHHRQQLVNYTSAPGPLPDYAFEMVCSTIRFGPGVTREVGFDLQTMGAKNTLVVSDPNVSQLKPFTTVADALTKEKLNFTVYDRCRVEPSDSSFKDAIEFARKGGFDSVIAVGGGSTMDTAKAAAIYAANPGADFFDYVCKPFGKMLNPEKAMLPLIAVPTTAGTGSETTTVAVFDLEETNTKSAIRSRAIKPHLALVDPENIASLPRHVAIYSGFDVLCHALESYTAKPFNQRFPRPEHPAVRPVYQGSNPVSDVWSKTALEIMRKYFRRSVFDAGDLEARSNMLLAACFAGMGFGNAGVHLCHGLSYPISSQGKSWNSPDYPEDHPLIPHGLSVILTACADFKFTADACPERHLQTAQYLGYEGQNSKLSDSGEILADMIKGFMADFKVANGLKAVGFDRSHAGKLAESAMHSVSALNLAPKEQTQDQIQKIYEDSIEIY